MEQDKLSSYHDHGLAEDPALERTVNLHNQHMDAIIMLTSDTIGNDDRGFGKSLLKQFVFSLTESAPMPGKIVLVNTAISLAMEGSEVMEPLHLLHEQGVEILICEQCIEHYGSLDKLVEGTIVSLHAITGALLSAKKVITL